MPFNFNIRANSADSHQTTAFWLAVVIPFQDESTYNYDNTNPGSITGVSGIKEGPLLIIDDDCIAWNVVTGKDSHVANLQMHLIKSNTAYANDISGDDWVIFWAFDNWNDYNTVKQQVQTLQRANAFNTAPKFIGRVSTIMKDKTTDLVGHRSVFYNVTCYGFVELDSNMYFDSLLQQLDPQDALSFFAFFEGSLKPDSPLGPLVQTDKVVPKLLKLCLGMGPSGVFKNGGPTTNPSLTTTPNEAFLIPKTVVKLLLDPSVLEGDTIKTVGPTYIDLLQMYVGVQNYTPPSTQTNAQAKVHSTGRADPNILGFIPNITSTISNNFYLASDSLTGAHLLVPLQFDNQTVWSVINHYIATPMNEIYTCLKIDPDGYVVPTVVCRQIPFSTNAFADENSVTRYLDLPRWNIDKSVVINIRTGKSAVLRQNYVHISPNVFMLNTNDLSTKELGLLLAQPVADPEDIKRSGLRPQIGTVGAVINQNNNDVNPSSVSEKQGRFWNRLIADSFFNGHQKWSGTATTRGIQKPICEGDNCVVDNVIYHIERVSHSGSINGEGKKDFITTLQLSMGISLDSDKDPDGLPVFPYDDDDDDLTTMGDF
jgi:hypothetical protein